MFFVSKLTVSAAKALINKGLPAFCRAFAAETDNFDKKHNIFLNNTLSAKAQNRYTAEHVTFGVCARPDAHK